jgi:hypothetical protein
MSMSRTYNLSHLQAERTATSDKKQVHDKSGMMIKNVQVSLIILY